MKFGLRFLGVALLGALFIHPVSAQQKYEWKTANSGGYEYRYVQDDPSQARFYTLKNGLTVILSPSHEKPRIQTYFAVKAGSKTDPADHTGLAHYLEHMLFKGTDKFGSLDWTKEKPLLDQIQALYENYNHTVDPTERKAIYHQIDSVSGVAAHFAIANEYDKMMASMGAKGTNAFTSFEQTVYTEDIPSNAIDRYLAVQAERFRHPVFRLFHTELEAVYEEKNRSLDSDGSKLFEAMFAGLFPHNNYGKQTTIGTIEHLKNPSLIAIRKYFNTYYVPNNIGIIMAGDFNPDEVIKKIDENFSYMTPKAIPPYTFEPEPKMTQPVVKTVIGPEPDRIMMGFRLPGASSDDAQILELVGSMLTNGSAGLIDLDLVKKQKLLAAYAFPYTLKDYSTLILLGMPGQGQSLEEVRDLLLAEINKLKTGDFSEDLITSIINNEKKDAIESNENYTSRAGDLMDNFTSDVDWIKRVRYIQRLNTITKQDIVNFANKYFDDNYVAVFKRQGEDTSIEKVEKPAITPVSVNRDDQSAFLQKINNMPEQAIQPVWLNFDKDIDRAKAGKLDVLSVKNTTNSLFRLNYYYQTGSWSNKLLPIAADYLEYIGTKDKSAEEISKEFYNLASSFSVNIGSERSYLSLDGLQDNFTQTVKLFDDLLQNCVADQDALTAYIARLKKSRANAKENKGQIMQGLIYWAEYGPKNPFNNELTDEELDNLKAEDLVNLLHQMADYNHEIIYYGPLSAKEVGSDLAKNHHVATNFLPYPKEVKFVKQVSNENRVLFSPYDMVQAEVYWIKNGDKYNAQEVPAASFFNEYFGGGMNSIVFQTLRESKALAYSTFAVYRTPAEKDDRTTFMAYIGAQSDKFDEATEGMNDLINNLPLSEKALTTAKTSIQKKMATERIIKDNIIFTYLTAQRQGLNYDIRKNIYEAIPGMDFKTLTDFQQKEIANKPFTYCIVSGEDKLSQEQMEKLGKIQKLSLEQIFGY